MTDKEFKRLSRAQLIDIIYQLQLKVDSLEKALEDKRLRMNKAGNIAEAALEINDCFNSAQKAADQYVREIKTIRAEAEVWRKKIISDAKEEAAEICAKIRSRLAEQDFQEVYIKILVYFNDVIALELLKELEKHYKERRRALKREGMDCWKHELAMIKDAIHHLKRVK